MSSWNMAHRYPPRYPSQALVLRLSSSGLATADVRSLSKALHAEAESHATGSLVCCFNLVEKCQARPLLFAVTSVSRAGAEPPSTV